MYLSEKLWQVYIIDGPEKKDALLRVRQLQFEVPRSHQHRLDGPHPVVVVVLGGELLRAQPVHCHNLVS